MNLVDQKFSQYLSSLDDQAAAGMLREVIFSLPEEQRRELIVKHCPEFKLDQNDGQKVHVTAYDDEDGAAWKLMFGDEVVEDGFQSTADAEMWARDNGYIPMSQEPERYRVSICRTGYGFTSIDVMARSPEEAEDLAHDEAGDHSYNEKSSEYTTDGVERY